MYTPGSPHFFYSIKDPPGHTKNYRASSAEKRLDKTLKPCLMPSIIPQWLQKTLTLTELLVCKPSPFLRRLPPLLHDYTRQDSSSHWNFQSARSSSSRPQLRACSSRGGPVGGRLAPGNSRRPPLGPGSRSAAAAASATSHAQDRPPVRVFRLRKTHGPGARGTTKPTYGSHRDRCSPTGPGELVLPSSLRAACCPRLTEPRQPPRHAETREKLFPACASSLRSPSRVGTSPLSGFHCLRREKDRLPCLSTATHMKNKQTSFHPGRK